MVRHPNKDKERGHFNRPPPWQATEVHHQIIINLLSTNSQVGQARYMIIYIYAVNNEKSAAYCN